jgi:hypothetical protein
VHRFGPAPAAEEAVVEWVDAESDSQEIKTELQRLKRRAAKRPVLLVLLCLAGVAAVLFKISRRVPIYNATIVMRVTEGVVVEEESPVVNQGLAHYLYTVALNTKRLSPIIETFDLYADERETFGFLHGIEKLRDALDIEVNANHFARARDEGDPVRSAGVSVHFIDKDPQLAFNVAQALSGALVAAEQERRAQMAGKISAIADSTVERVEIKLASLKSQLAATLIAVDETLSASERALLIAENDVRKRRLIQGVTQTELLLEQVIADQNETSLAIAAEGADQALRFEVMDVRPPIIKPKTSPVAYALLGLFVFICLVPVCAIGIAALDTRLHHIEDLIRLDLPVVGHMASFPSDRMGSMQDRSRKAKDIA